MSRLVAHVDMDCFYAAVEARDDPSLAGQPVIVGGLSARGVVSSASYEARRFGVRSAMPIFQARRLCPEGVFLPVRMVRYRQVSAEVMDILAAFAPVLEPVSVDEAFLDLTGTERLYGPPEKIGRRIKSLIGEGVGLTCSVGLAPNRLVAKIASDLQKPDGLVVVRPDEAARFLAGMEVGRLPGVGPKLAWRMRALGLVRIRDLARLDKQEMERLFGSAGPWLFEAAQGRDETPVQPPSLAKSISAEETLERDTGRLEDLAPHLAAQAMKVGRRLRLKGMCARTVCLKLKRSNFQMITRSKSLAEPFDDTRTIFQTAAGLLAAHHQGQPVRLIGLAVSHLTPALDRQPDLFEAGWGWGDRVSLDKAVDEILGRFGPEAIKFGLSLKKD